MSENNDGMNEGRDKDQENVKRTMETLLRARQIAIVRGHEYVTLEHVLLALLENEEVLAMLVAIGVDTDLIRQETLDYLSTDVFPVTGTSQPIPTDPLDHLITRTVGYTAMSGRGKPTPSDVMLHLVQMPHEDSFAVTILLKCGATPLSIKKFLSHGSPKKFGAVGPDGEMIGPGPMPGGEFSSPEEAEAFLEKFTLNLNKHAESSKIDPLIGREKEVGLLIQIMARRTKNNGVLVGEPGVGKTAIAEGLALKIVRKEVPEVLLPAKIYSLDIGALLAGTRFRGDFEERMKQVLKALEMIPNSILFIDEIHNVMGAGASSQGTMDVANLMKPGLAKGTLRAIGSTTLEEFRKHFEKDRALLRRFKKVDVFEPSPEDTKLILRGLRENYEKFHGVTYTDEALDAAVDLTTRYVTGSYLPDKAIDIIDNAGARQRVALPEQRKAQIDVADVEFEVSTVAKIPIKNVSQSDEDKLVNLLSNLKANVYGQDGAMEEVNSAMFISNAGLREPNKPIGCYLFTGPTGTGKTETAKTIADTLNIPLLRFDMSEFMEKHSVARIIGAPPGYVGFGEGNAGSGQMINEVDTNPHCVLLLDEIEKAHPDVFNILLQVMDNGSLTSSAGKKVDFRNVVLIMTANTGSRALTANKIGFGQSKDKDADEGELKRVFSPEFRNRLDEIIKFDFLKPEVMEIIVRKFIRQLEELAGHREIKIEITDAAVARLAKDGYSEDMGARPLAKEIRKQVKEPLSKLIITGPLKQGGLAKIDLVDEKIVVSA
jgi:ATP-dependent Clp protease ATP-binding subunit ClpA